MDLTLRIFTISLSTLVFFSVISMMVKRRLNESNSILWLLIGFLTLLSGCFPGMVNRIATFLGIAYPPTLLFLLAIIALLLIVFKCSMEISKMQSKVNEIAIILSILREENKRLTAKRNGTTKMEVGDTDQMEWEDL